MSISALKINPFEMQSLTEWEDAWSFADCVVAFKTSYEYFGANIQLSLIPEKTVKFGYITRLNMPYITTPAHNMHRLIESGRRSSSCALTTQRLSNNPLAMRYAYSEEVYAIAKAINSRKARFDLIGYHEAKVVEDTLNRQLIRNHQYGTKQILEELLPNTINDPVAIVDYYLVDDLPPGLLNVV